MRDEAWIEAGKRMILRQFYIRESMRIFLMFVMCMVISILWAMSTGQMAVFLIAIGITVLIVLRMVTIGSREFHNAFADLYPPRQEQIIVDYLQPHTVYRLFGGGSSYAFRYYGLPERCKTAAHTAGGGGCDQDHEIQRRKRFCPRRLDHNGYHEKISAGIYGRTAAKHQTYRHVAEAQKVGDYMAEKFLIKKES